MEECRIVWLHFQSENLQDIVRITTCNKASVVFCACKDYEVWFILLS